MGGKIKPNLSKNNKIKINLDKKLVLWEFGLKIIKQT